MNPALDIAEEIDYLARLSGTPCADWKHTLISSKVDDPVTLTPKAIWSYTVPDNATWVMCCFLLRSLPPVNDPSLTVDDWRSDDFDANGLTLAYIAVNGSPINVHTLGTFGIFNKPLLLAFAAKSLVQMFVQRDASSVAPNAVVHSCAHGYLTKTEAYSRLSENLTTIEAALSAAGGLCVITESGSLQLGGAFTRTSSAVADPTFTNAYIIFAGFLSGPTGFRSYNISNPSAPAFAGTMVAGADHNIFSASVLDGAVVYCGGTFGDFPRDVTAIDVSSPALPALISILTRAFPLGCPLGMAVKPGAVLYLVDNASRLSLVDITTPAAMVTIADYDEFTDFGFAQVGLTCIVVVGSVAYLLSYDTVTPAAYLGIYDVSVPLAVTQTSTLQVATPFAGPRRSALRVIGTTAYTLSDDKFVIVNVAVPAVPVIISTTIVVADTVSTGPTQVSSPAALFVNAAQTRAFILNQETRSLYVYNITDPTAPVLIDTLATKPTSSPESVIGTATEVFVTETEAPTGSTEGWLEDFDYSGCV